MIKAIIFDLGGVYFSDGANIAFEKISSLVKVPQDKLERVFHGKKRSLRGLFYRGRIEPKEFWKRAAQEMGVSSATARKLRKIWYSAYTPNRGIKELILKLKKKYKLIIFSGNIKERVAYLEKKYEFKQYFDGLVFSFDVGATKKEPIFYKALITTLNNLNVKPEEAILVDDKEKALEMAKSFRINTILFKDAGQLKWNLNRFGIKIVYA